MPSVLAENQKQAEEWEGFIVEKGKNSDVPWLVAGGCLPGKLQAGQVEEWNPMWLVKGIYLASSGWV